MLSIIIPARDAEGTLAVQLRALARQEAGFPIEVIVVDNDSTDATAEVARTHADRLEDLKVLHARERHGAAYARNRGAERATHPLLAFVDADDEVAPGWAGALVEALERHELVGSRWDMKRLSTRAAGSRLVSAQEDSLQRLPYPPYLLHAGAGGMGVRKDLHERLGGFDESWPLLEDTEYCIRAQRLGATLGFAGDALVHVRPRAELRAACRQAYRWGKTNTRLYREFRGAHRDPLRLWGRFAKGSVRLAGGLAHLRREGAGAQLLYRGSWRLGALSGAVVYRVPPVV